VEQRETAEQGVGGQPSEGTQAPATQEGAEATTPSYVFALGRVEQRFPTLGVEKEFAQATGRVEAAGLTDQQALHSVLSDRANRHLVRQLCFVLTIEGLETYILQPRDSVDFELLVEAVRPATRPTDVDVVIGTKGPIASAEACNGLTVPIVGFDQLYSFDVDSLIGSIPSPENLPEDEQESFRATAEELFYRIMQIADNAGATDEHRALNYLAVRYDRIYALTAEQFRGNFSLSGVEVRPSRLSGTRKIVDVIFSYTHRETNVDEKYFIRVDVTEEFLFLVTRMSPFYER
jgi:hypothetical protein